MNKAQKFLINKGYNDLVITNPNIVDPKKWVYVSDAIMEFQRNLTNKSTRRANNEPKLSQGDYPGGVLPPDPNDFYGYSSVR